MANANYKTICNVSHDQFIKAVTDYTAYPKFVEGCTRVEIEKISDLESHVTYYVSMMSQTLFYKLNHKMNESRTELSWALMESDKLTKNSGIWKFSVKDPNKVEVDYTIDIDFNFPIPGFLLSGLVRGSLPKMISSIEKYAASL